MPPKRIMFIRHAEKPGVGNNDRGVAADGEPDDESLTVRGWQRAGALIALFCADLEMRPNTIFASGIGHDSKSRRPAETVTPLADALKNIQPVAFNKTHMRDDLQPLMDEVLSQEGTVLVSWEHKRIRKLVAMLPGAPPVPQDWPDDRFDIVWVFDRAGAGWSFAQMPQRLLPGDSLKPIV